MRSKETLSLFKSAKEIHVAISADGERIGALLNEKNPLPVPEGEAAFDYRLHFQHLSHQLGVAVDATARAEDAHAAELIRIARYLSERDDAVQAGYGTLVSVRQGLEGLFEEGAFELGFLKGETPQTPSHLLEQLGQTLRFLRQPAVGLQDVKIRGFSVDLEAVASEVEAEIATVRNAIDELAMARKQAEGALVIKRAAVGELRGAILWAGRTAEGLFHLAGESELARRIRKSTRRPRRPSEQHEEEPAEQSTQEPDQEAGQEPDQEPDQEPAPEDPATDAETPQDVG